MRPPVIACSILIALFLPSRPGLKGQDFDRWFTGGVLRLDMVFTGSAGQGSYTLLGIRSEPFFSGSRTTLIDPFDYGDHMMQVRDAETGLLIFSHTYSTLYREWLTTSESDSLRRAFNHVVRFPMPRSAVRVELYDRDRGGRFHLKWAETVDPSSIYIDPGNPLKFGSVDLEINGPAAEKVDILFLAEGYTATEMEKFLEDARRSAGYIFSEEPFKSHRKEFNIRVVLSVSDESGTDIPGDSIWKSTALHSTFYTFGIERYMTTMDYISVCNAAANAHYDQIYILVNTGKYGGGGIYNYYSISAADNEDSRAVVIHEFGHSFGGLADEYFSSAVAYNDFFPLDVEPWNPNLTTMVNFPAKWEDLLEPETPVPTPAEKKFRKTVGVYEGGGYVSTGVFRPMIDCRMHTNDAAFCPVCVRALEQMIRRQTGK